LTTRTILNATGGKTLTMTGTRVNDDATLLVTWRE
jgi:hypothetical protein